MSTMRTATLKRAREAYDVRASWRYSWRRVGVVVGLTGPKARTYAIRWATLEGLPPPPPMLTRGRMALKLWRDGMSYGEIAVEIGGSYNSIAKAIRRERAKNE